MGQRKGKNISVEKGFPTASTPSDKPAEPITLSFLIPMQMSSHTNRPALRPLLWEVCCDAYTRFKSNYEAAKGGGICFGVRRFELD